ncbi:MAG: FtsK/SpoIIIE domain-containing protein [Phycisphaerae bacterium]
MDQTPVQDNIERTDEAAAANGNGQAAPAVPTLKDKGPSEREQQRAALRELVELSTQCAAEERQIEEARAAELAKEAKDHERSVWGADERAKNAEGQVREKHAERTGRIKAEYGQSTAVARDADAKGKKKVQLDFGPQEAKVKKAYDEAVWLADAELEARQAQVRVEQRKAKDDLKEQGEETDALESKAQDLLKLYKHKSNEIDAAAMAGEAEAPGNFAAKRDATTAEIARLEALFAPRLFVGGRPILIVLVLLAIAGGATYVMNMEKAFKPDPYVIAGGATLVGSVALLLVIRSAAKKSLRRQWTRTWRALDETRKASKHDYEQTLDALSRRADEAAQKRAGEVGAAKQKYQPMLTSLGERKKAAVAAIDADTAAKTKGHTERRDQLNKEATDSLERHLADLKAKLAKEHEQIEAKHKAKVADIKQRHADARAALEMKWKDGLARIARPIEQTGGGREGEVVYDWSSVAWKDWTPPKRFAQLIRFGELEVDLKAITDQVPQKLALPAAFSVPANLAFPRQSSLLIHTDREGRPEAMAAMQMVMARLLTNMPAGRVKFTIIDPVGLGQNFAGFMHLADHDESLVGSRIWTEREHIEQRLLNLTEHMETVIQKYLRNEYETIDEYNAQAGELAEPYRFLVIADFPVGFEGDSFRRLSSIASTGARCGVYTLVVRDTRVPMPQGAHFDELEAHSVNLVRQNGRFVWRDEVFKQFPLKVDAPPNEATLTEMMDVVGRYAKDANRVEVPFWQIAPRDESEFWTRTAKRDLDVPVGRMGATRLQSLKLGKGVAQHALVAGKTGSGKSTLLHAMVTNIAMWYRPDEVELYLIDFKKGVEFKTYASHELPHARAIAVESDREFGLSVLQRLDAELTRRGEIFRKLGVQDLASFRDSGSGPMPRVLLVIDEFQEFFSEDDKLAQDSSTLIDRLVRQGRAFGIHVFLGSQTIGGTSGLSRSTIGQMAVRIALQTSEADSQLILGDGNSAARLLSRPGEAIYNDAGGLVEANSPFQVAWLPDEQRDEFLTAVLEKTKRENAFYGDPAVVFEGNAPADVTKNVRLRALLDGPRPSESAPPPAAPVGYLGEPVAIKDPSGIALRRQSGSNILVIGQQDESAMALVQAMIVSLAAQHSKTSCRFVLFDGTPADSNLTGILPKVREVVPQEVEIVEYRAVEETMAKLADEQARRQAADDQAAPAVYIIVFGLQRFRALRKSEDSGFSFGSSMSDEGGEKKVAADKAFAELLREGPGFGLHVIGWIDTPVSIERTLDRSSMREFDNRVLFQMSANDSSNLIDSPAANKLGMFRALAYSEEQGTMEKFRPYALLPEEFLTRVKEKLRP